MMVFRHLDALPEDKRPWMSVLYSTVFSFSGSSDDGVMRDLGARLEGLAACLVHMPGAWGYCTIMNRRSQTILRSGQVLIQ